MATTPTKPDIDVATPFTGVNAPAWPRGQSAESADAGFTGQDISADESLDPDDFTKKPSQLDALQALLAFSALHEQVRRRKALAVRHVGFDAGAPISKFEQPKFGQPGFEPEFEKDEQFVLDEVLQLVAERALAITGCRRTGHRACGKQRNCFARGGRHGAPCRGRAH